MGSIVARLLLAISAYSPLAAVFFFLLLRKHPVAAFTILLIALIGLAGLWLYLSMVQKLSPLRIKIESFHRRDAEMLRYVVSYLIPFLAIPFSDFVRAVSLFAFFLLVIIVYVKSNLIHVNPILTVIGYRQYEVTLEGGGSHFLITRRQVVRGDSVFVIKLGEDFLLEKRNET